MQPNGKLEEKKPSPINSFPRNSKKRIAQQLFYLSSIVMGWIINYQASLSRTRVVYGDLNILRIDILDLLNDLIMLLHYTFHIG